MFPNLLTALLLTTSEPPVVPAALPPCAITDLRVDKSARYRGAAYTPAHQAWLDSLDGDSLAMARAEDHGASHHLCTYSLTALGGRWRWTETWDTTFEDKPTGWCNTAIPEVVAQIRSSTKECTQPERGAWWGHRLEALDSVAEAILDKSRKANELRDRSGGSSGKAPAAAGTTTAPADPTQK